MINEDEIWKDNVQAVLKDIEEWAGEKPCVHHCDQGRLTVEVETDRMGPDRRAQFIQWYVEQGWRFETLDMARQTVTMCGDVSKIPVESV